MEMAVVVERRVFQHKVGKVMFTGRVADTEGVYT